MLAVQNKDSDVLQAVVRHARAVTLPKGGLKHRDDGWDGNNTETQQGNVQIL